MVEGFIRPCFSSLYRVALTRHAGRLEVALTQQSELHLLNAKWTMKKSICSHSSIFFVLNSLVTIFLELISLLPNQATLNWPLFANNNAFGSVYGG